MTNKGIDVSDLTPCCACGNELGPVFYRIGLEQHIVNGRSVQQLVGLTSLVGNAQLAKVFAPSTEVTVQVSSVKGLYCQTCVFDSEVTRTLFAEVGQDEDKG